MKYTTDELEGMSDAILNASISSVTADLTQLTEERQKRREAIYGEQLALNPWKRGDRVTTLRSVLNYEVLRITAASVVVDTPYSPIGERIPLKRVLPADPEKDKRGRTYSW